LLAESYEKAGEIQAGLKAVEEGLAIVSQNGEGHHEAELYRLRGELILKCDAPASRLGTEQAKDCLRKAIDLAQQQGAKAWELRAVMSLFRARSERADHADARALLEKACGQFTEGFETADLQEAKALLAT
jgi:predicted ATPase